MGRTSTSMLLAATAVRQARGDADPDAQRNAALARACLRRGGAAGARLLSAVDHAPGRALLSALEWLSVPAIGAHYAWRKRRIREWAVRACAGGARQALILGAGFDGLSLALLARDPALRVFEIERESSLAIKRAALSELHCDTARLSMIGADLSVEPLDALLRAQPGFDPQAPTLAIAEGVLMYLPQDDLHRLLRALARTLPGATLIATAMDRPRGGAPGFVRQRAWVGDWLRRGGEPFRWGATRAELPAWLGEAGVSVERFADPNAADDPDPAPGEWLFAGRLTGATQAAPVRD